MVEKTGGTIGRTDCELSESGSAASYLCRTDCGEFGPLGPGARFTAIMHAMVCKSNVAIGCDVVVGT